MKPSTDPSPIIKMAKQLLFTQLPKMVSLKDELDSPYFGLHLRFKPYWLDRKYKGDMNARNTAMHEASEQLAKWFEAMFGTQVKVVIKYFGHEEEPYDGNFRCCIMAVQPKRKWWSLRK